MNLPRPVAEALARNGLRVEMQPIPSDALSLHLISEGADPAAMPPTIFPRDARGFILLALPPLVTDALAASGLRAGVTSLSGDVLGLRVERIGAPPLDPVAMPPAIFPTDAPDADLVRRLFAAFLRM